MPKPLSRRDLIALMACSALPLAQRARLSVRSLVASRLKTRPHRPSGTILPGRHPLGLAEGRDGFLVVPANYSADRPAPLVLALHGATQEAMEMVTRGSLLVDKGGCLMLAVDSRGMTWDAIRGEYGPDVDFIDRALEFAFAHCSVEAARVMVAGFSDGASYALGLGLINGDLFSRVMAFSPGFIPPSDEPPVGKPKIFISHGTSDQILPIDQTSRRLVPALQRSGYEVTYQEFDGRHQVPPSMVEAAIAWMAKG